MYWKFKRAKKRIISLVVLLAVLGGYVSKNPNAVEDGWNFFKNRISGIETGSCISEMLDTVNSLSDKASDVASKYTGGNISFDSSGIDLTTILNTIESEMEDNDTDGTESSEAYTVVNNNVPTFTEEEITTESFEFYSDLDELGRCGVAEACIGTDIMPTEKRGEIGQIKPSGWHTVKYPEYISDRYLYNRCHLIGYQLTGENANEKNLITGTRYLNVTGMLPFENEVADYIKSTGNHVMYRVTPYFKGNELVARGVFMEAYSVEDNGEGVSFNVYCYNVQPYISINYATGDSWVTEE